MLPTPIVTAALDDQPPADAAGIQGRSPWQLAWGRLRADRMAWFAGSLVLFVILLALSAPILSAVTGHSGTEPNVDYGTSDTGQPLPPGSVGTLLGTDSLGRDVLVRVAYGAQTSLLVGLLATAMAVVFGVVVGLVAGYVGGWVDALLARTMDVVLSFPYVLFAVVLVSVFGPSLLILLFVIAFFSWATIGRIVRGQTLSQREKEYVEAAHSIGAGPIRIMFIEILPNLIAPVIVLATLLIPAAIVFEASLSFLGLGTQPPVASWGNMLSDAEGTGFEAWWFYLFPGLALLITTLGFNLLGDSIRDALDPRGDALLRGKAGKRRRKARANGGAPEPATGAPG